MSRQPWGAHERQRFSPTQLVLRDFVHSLFRHRRLMVACLLAILAITTIVTLLRPPQYEVTAGFLVHRSRAEVALSPTDSSYLLVSGVNEEDIRSEIEILKSPELIEKALLDLDLAQGALQAGPDDLSKRIEQLNRDLDFRNVSRSHVIEVSYRSPDPEWATRVVRSLTDAYIARRSEVFQTEETVEFFNGQLQESGKQLEMAKDALEARSRETGILLLPRKGESNPVAAEAELMLTRLSRFEEELSQSRIAVEEASSRVEALQRQLRHEPERRQSSHREHLDPEIETLETALATLRLERDGLLQRYSRESNVVSRVEEQIRLADERLRDVQDRNEGVSGTDVNRVYEALSIDFQQAKSLLEAARARHEGLELQVVAERAAYQRLQQEGREVEKLQRQAEAAEQAYLLFQKKHQEASISTAMSRQRMVNVSLIKEPRMPVTPASRDFPLSLALGVVLATTASMIAVLVRSYLDRTLCFGGDLMFRLAIPHLASVPDNHRGAAAVTLRYDARRHRAKGSTLPRMALRSVAVSAAVQGPT